MATVQSTYARVHARWVEGMLLNSEPHLTVSRSAEDAEGIGFGKVCVQGTDDHQVVDSEATAKFVGIALLDPTKSGGAYAQYDEVNVLKRGVVVVTASVAVAPGQPVYYTPATGALTNVSNSAANTLIANAQWETTTAGAGLAALRLNG